MRRVIKVHKNYLSVENVELLTNGHMALEMIF